MGQQQQQSPGLGQSTFNVGRDMNWLNTASKLAPSARAGGGMLGSAGKAFAPFALAAGAQGTAKGVGELWDAYQKGDGGLAVQGGLRTTGGLAAMTAGGIGTTALLGAGATALGGSSLLAGTAAGAGLATGGAAMAGAAAAAAPVAAIAAPIAAAIGLGFRGDAYAKETGLFGQNAEGENRGVGDVYSDTSDWISEGLGGGFLGDAAGVLGGGITAGAAALGAGVLGVASDIGNFASSAWSAVTSW